MKKISVLLAALAIFGTTLTAPAVVINEFLYNTDGGACFVELYNRSSVPVEISGWQLQQGDTTGNWVTLATIDAGTTLPAGAHYLIASQDLFITVPDQEENFVIAKGAATVQGLRLATNTSVKDTVLYARGTSPADSGLRDDANALRWMRTDALLANGTGTNVDIDAAVSTAAGGPGMGARRLGPGGAATGDGYDTNDAAVDFAAFTVGSASPRSMSTPVTMTTFEAK